MRKTFKIRFVITIVVLLLGLLFVKWQISKKVLTNNLVLNTTVMSNEKLDNLLSNESEISILIDKSDYQLHVYSADTIVKTYPVVLGGNPIDDKLRQGDQCTPEGTFKIVSKYPHRSWSKFIWINYPTPDSWRKHKKAKVDGIIPKDAKIGGEIGIHGVPKNTDYMIAKGTNWTLGCISLTNADINELYPVITDKTKITIQK